MTLFNHIKDYILWAIYLAIISIPINIVLIILRWCSIKYILFIYKIRRILINIPSNMILRAHGREIVFVEELENGEEIEHPFYSGVLTWKSGNRLAKRF